MACPYFAGTVIQCCVALREVYVPDAQERQAHCAATSFNRFHACSRYVRALQFGIAARRDAPRSYDDADNRTPRDHVFRA